MYCVVLATLLTELNNTIVHFNQAPKEGVLSWAAHLLRKQHSLPINRTPSPHPSPSAGERVPEGRVSGPSPGVQGRNARTKFGAFSPGGEFQVPILGEFRR